jgi:hypothetical protein
MQAAGGNGADANPAGGADNNVYDADFSDVEDANGNN